MFLWNNFRTFKRICCFFLKWIKNVFLILFASKKRWIFINVILIRTLRSIVSFFGKWFLLIILLFFLIWKISFKQASFFVKISFILDFWIIIYVFLLIFSKISRLWLFIKMINIGRLWTIVFKRIWSFPLSFLSLTDFTLTALTQFIVKDSRLFKQFFWSVNIFFWLVSVYFFRSLLLFPLFIFSRLIIFAWRIFWFNICNIMLLFFIAISLICKLNILCFRSE